jgi:hypothetical protein
MIMANEKQPIHRGWSHFHKSVMRQECGTCARHRGHDGAFWGVSLLVCTLDLEAGKAAILIELASSLGEEGREDGKAANLRKQTNCHHKDMPVFLDANYDRRITEILSLKCVQHSESTHDQNMHTR